MRKFKLELLFFVLFVVARLPFLGQEMFNTDVWKWKARIYDFGSGVFNLNFDKTVQKYHPGVTLMWVGTLAIKAQGLYCGLMPSCPNEATDPVGAIFNLHFFQKLGVVLALGLTFTFIFYPLRKLFGGKYALISLSILTFEPFFYALSRVIHLEALMTGFMLASFVWLFYTLEKDGGDNRQTKKSGLVASGVFAGLAVLTKSSALFMVPFSLLAILFLKKANFEGATKLFSIWFLSVVATYFILWPAMWVQPLQTLDYVFIRGVKEVGVEGGHEQIFLGRFTEDPGPFYYFVVIALKFSSILVTGIVLFGFLLKGIRRYFDHRKVQKFIILALFFAFGYLLEISIPSKKLDRYILPTLGSLALIAGFMYTRLLNLISTQPKIDKVLCHLRSRASRPGGTGTRDEKGTSLVVMMAFLVIVAFQSLALTPDYFSYYNPLFGGLAKGVYALEPKWIIGQHQVANYFFDLMKKQNLEPFRQGQSLNNQKDLSRKLIVAFPEKYYTQIWPFIQKTGAWATIEDLTGDAKRSTYFIYPVWDDFSAKETRYKLVYTDSIYLRGVKLYNVYARHDR